MLDRPARGLLGSLHGDRLEPRSCCGHGGLAVARDGGPRGGLLGEERRQRRRRRAVGRDGLGDAAARGRPGRAGRHRARPRFRHELGDLRPERPEPGRRCRRCGRGHARREPRQRDSPRADDARSGRRSVVPRHVDERPHPRPQRHRLDDRAGQLHRGHARCVADRPRRRITERESRDLGLLHESIDLSGQVPRYGPRWRWERNDRRERDQRDLDREG